MKNLSCALYGVLLVCVGVAWSAPAKKPVKTAPPKVAAKPTAVPSKYAQKPFDMRWQAVPVGYRGHDVEQIYKALVPRIQKMRKDEEILAYLNRMEAYVKDTKPLWGEVKLSSTFTKVQELETQYDATTGIMRLHFPLLRLPDDLLTAKLKDRGLVPFSSQPIGETTYYKDAKGQQIIKGSFNQYALALNGWESFPVPKSSIGPIGQLEAEMSPQQAKMAGKDLKLLLIYGLNWRYHDKVTQRVPPGDFPFDTTTIHHVVHGDLKEIWLYHAKTGELWMKFWPKRPETASSEP